MNLVLPQLTSEAMAESLSILLIDDNAIRASIIEAGLREAGHATVQIVTDMEDVAGRIRAFAPDVVIVDLENPNRDVLEHFFALSRTIERPIAMFVDKSDPAEIEAAVEAGVSAYVVDGLRKERIKPILDMAIVRFRAYSRLRNELEAARSELQGRKIIERAKGILMRTRGFSEEEAYALLRSTAMNQNRKILEIAQALVTASELLGP
ncbi:ANTAR domain-containing protein [Devosia sp. 1566]|uniref:ANTAR domain-containing response regulator n=1 Tax=Devosia sp. 1566 TaxID=2499144 RepID=UPI0020BF0B69|nr:ANTAR domain-containing protein [Devosia sp. 1566]